MTLPRVIPAQAGIHAPLRFVVVGAPGTGKTRLAAELAAYFAERVLPHTVIELQDAPAAQDSDATLLMGLDLPSSAGREAEDARLRASLQAQAIAFQVVYGHGPQRLQSALQALGLLAREDAGASGRDWTWVCDKCSDPACEHRLFSRLKERTR